MADNEMMGGSGFWIFALLILFGMGGGFGFGGYNGQAATVNDLNETSNFTRLENQVRANAELTERKTDAINNGLCSLGYEMAQQFGVVNLNAANNTALINATTTAQTQKILDALAQNKIDSLQARINQLEMQNMMCGVVKYPLATTYCSGQNPFCGGCN